MHVLAQSLFFCFCSTASWIPILLLSSLGFGNRAKFEVLAQIYVRSLLLFLSTVKRIRFLLTTALLDHDFAWMLRYPNAFNLRRTVKLFFLAGHPEREGDVCWLVRLSNCFKLLDLLDDGILLKGLPSPSTTFFVVVIIIIIILIIIITITIIQPK